MALAVSRGLVCVFSCLSFVWFVLQVYDGWCCGVLRFSVMECYVGSCGASCGDGITGCSARDMSLRLLLVVGVSCSLVFRGWCGSALECPVMLLSMAGVWWGTRVRADVVRSGVGVGWV